MARSAAATAAPVRRGSRVALPPATPQVDKGETSVYVVTGRPLRFRGLELPAGTEVPGAAGWLRVDAWVSARRIRPIHEGEEYKPYAEFLTENDLVDPEEAALAARLESEQTEQEPAPAEE